MLDFPTLLIRFVGLRDAFPILQFQVTKRLLVKHVTICRQDFSLKHFNIDNLLPLCCQTLRCFVSLNYFIDSQFGVVEFRYFLQTFSHVDGISLSFCNCFS